MNKKRQQQAKRNIRIQQRVLLAGTLIMVGKFVGWILTNSNAILSDALESIINIVAGSFALFSLYLAAQPRDRNHPYGHGKVEYISAGLEGALILIAGITVMGKAVYNIYFPQVINQLNWGILLTGIAGLFNFVLARILMLQGKKTNSLIMIADGKHLLSDAWSSVGLLIGLGLLWFFELPLIDNISAIIFGIVILVTGYRLVRQSLAGIMDEANEEVLEELVTLLREKRQDDWIDIHNLRVIRYGSILHIDCHMTLPWYYSTRQSHDIVETVEALIQAEAESEIEFFIHVDPCTPSACRICQQPDCHKRKFPFKRRLKWTMDNLLENERHVLQP